MINYHDQCNVTREQKTRRDLSGWLVETKVRVTVGGQNLKTSRRDLSGQLDETRIRTTVGGQNVQERSSGRGAECSI